MSPNSSSPFPVSSLRFFLIFGAGAWLPSVAAEDDPGVIDVVVPGVVDAAALVVEAVDVDVSAVDTGDTGVVSAALPLRLGSTMTLELCPAFSFAFDLAGRLDFLAAVSGAGLVCFLGAVRPRPLPAT